MKKIFWIALIFCLVTPLCVYGIDGSDFDTDKDGDVDGEDLARFSEYFGKLLWYKDADGDGYSDGTKIWAVSRPTDYYLAGELTSLTGDPNDNNDQVHPPIYEGNYSISNIDDIQAISGYVEITGDVVIGSPYLLSLQGLESLTIVGGSLIIQSVIFPNLSGLDNLTSVGFSLDINNNGPLNDITALHNLTSIGSTLVIEGNANLPNLSGLDNVTSLGGSLIIKNNSLLSSLSALDGISFTTDQTAQILIEDNVSLTSTFVINNATLDITGSMSILRNDDLINLSGFEAITSVNLLHLEGNAALTSLSGLNNLTSVVDNLRILNNDDLTNLSGLESLTSVGMDLHITGNASLISLSGLDNLSSVYDDLLIVNNDVLTSLTGLESLTSVSNMGISENPALTSISSLNNLTSVGAVLSIAGNGALTSLSGLNNLISVPYLDIVSNDALAILGLDSLCSVNTGFVIEANNNLCENLAEDLRDQVQACPGGGIGSYIVIINNKACPAYTGDYTVEGPSDIVVLSGYSEVTGDLIINNPTIPVTSLLGLEGLTSIGGNLIIINTAALTSLAGLDNLASIGNSLVMEYNDDLTSLGLDSLCSVNAQFFIQDHNNLCENLAEDLKDQVQTCPGGGIGGFFVIQRNKTCP